MKDRKKTFDKKYKMILFVLPLIIGFILIGIQVLYELDASGKKIDDEVAAYRTLIESRMIDEVNGAVNLANFYYEEHNDSLTTEKLQENIAIMLSGIHSEEIGYFFATTYNGVAMFGPAEGQNMYDIEDVNGLKVVQELIKKAKDGGGFVEYIMPQINGYDERPRLSYVLPFEHYNWYIGFGVALDDVSLIEEKIRADSKEKNISIFTIMGVSIISLMIILALINNMIYIFFRKQLDYLHQGIENIDLLNDLDNHDVLSVQEFSDIGHHLFNVIQENKQVQSQLTEQFETCNFTAETLKETNQHLELEVAAHEKSLLSLEISRQRFKAMINSLPDAFFVISNQGIFIDCEVKDDQWLLYGRQDFIGKNIDTIMPSDISQMAMKKINLALETNLSQVMEYTLESDRTKYYKLHFSRYSKTEVFAILKDVSDLKESQINNIYLSYHDALTQTNNKRYFEEQIRKLDRPDAYPLTVVAIDVNGLKLINDAFGHIVGDELLKLVASILKSFQEDYEFIARTGGDEFAIIFRETGSLEVQRILTEIQNEIKALRFHHTIVSISMGWSSKTKESEVFDDVIVLAEEEMYRKKLTESQEMRHKTTSLIMKTLDENIPAEKIHNQRVANISKEIARAMRLDDETIKHIETAGLLHDVGKITIDYDLLNKTTKLSPGEINDIRKHPEGSYRILKTIDAYAPLAEGVLSHHEHYDGNGYPRGLSKNDIPLMSRILAVADAYEAMTSHRPYKNRISDEEAMIELKAKAGSQFDPLIVDIFEQNVFNTLNEHL